jgi:hypothetical protein
MGAPDPFDSLSHEAGGLTLDESSAGLEYDYRAMYEAGYFPMGSNSLPLSLNFEERLRYKNADYFKDFGLPKPLDSLYNKNFYGRVDPLQNVIVPVRLSPYNPFVGTAGHADMYKQIAEENIFALGFVADNFFDFRRNMKIASERSCLTEADSVLANPKATRGWVDYEDLYHSLFQTLVGAYNRYLQNLDKEKFNKIVSFKDYADGLYDYLLVGNYDVPITLTEFVVSPLAPPMITGICIEIAQQDHSKDLPKFTKYIRDVNFSYYVKAARKYGFYVDKNAPWRLWADLYSDPMLNRAFAGGVLPYALSQRRSGIHMVDLNNNGYADNPELDPTVLSGGTSIAVGDWPSLSTAGPAFGTGPSPGPAEMFELYYQPTYLLDLRLFIKKLTAAWNDFVVENPHVVEVVPGTVRCPEPTFRIINFRYTISLDAAQKLGDRYWFSYYLNLRERETGVTYRNKPLLIERALQILHLHNLNEALKYLNNLFKGYLYDERFFANNKLTAKK